MSSSPGKPLMPVTVVDISLSEKEEAMKAARAQKALERAQAAKEGKERLAAANAAVEGLKPCPDGAWGSNTGLLSAQSCYRVRDGTIESKARTGAFLIF